MSNKFRGASKFEAPYKKKDNIILFPLNFEATEVFEAEDLSDASTINGNNHNRKRKRIDLKL